MSTWRFSGAHTEMSNVSESINSLIWVFFSSCSMTASLRRSQHEDVTPTCLMKRSASRSWFWTQRSSSTRKKLEKREVRSAWMRLQASLHVCGHEFETRTRGASHRFAGCSQRQFCLFLSCLLEFLGHLTLTWNPKTDTHTQVSVLPIHFILSILGGVWLWWGASLPPQSHRDPSHSPSLIGSSHSPRTCAPTHTHTQKYSHCVCVLVQY